MLKTLALAVTIATATATAALAAGDHKGKHGGKVVESGHHHLELVAADGSLTLYVRDEADKPEDVAKAEASATVLAGGKTEAVALRPADGGVFSGKGGFKAGKGTTVVITLKMPKHKPEQARFKLD
jgi:hypothetical protein